MSKTWNLQREGGGVEFWDNKLLKMEIKLICNEAQEGYYVQKMVKQRINSEV